MVTHKFKCLFVHIPKAAGQSIESFFLKLHGLDWRARMPLLLLPNNNPHIGPPYLAHLSLHEYKKFHYISEDQFEDYFKFTFVRNPWSRVVSFYKYGNFDKHISFRHFVTKVLPAFVRERHYFYKPQHDFIFHNEHSQMDFIGSFENLHKDFQTVCDKLDLPEKRLPHVNKGNEKRKMSFIQTVSKRIIERPGIYYRISKDTINSDDYRDYYNRSLIKKVERLYKKDIETFNYSFEVAEPIHI